MTRFVQLENVNDPADIYVNPAAVNMVRAVGLDNAHVYFNNDLKILVKGNCQDIVGALSDDSLFAAVLDRIAKLEHEIRIAKLKCEMSATKSRVIQSNGYDG